MYNSTVEYLFVVSLSYVLPISYIPNATLIALSAETVTSGSVP